MGMIETLFPAGVHTCSLSEEVNPELLYPEEASCIPNAAPFRRREFAQGRLCARQALAELGIRNFPLLTGKDRRPIWPQGIVGSLTHCGGYCAVAVTRADSFSGLGIDVEAAEPLGRDLIPLVCVEQEISRLQESPESTRGVLAKLLFSAKESVFKCVYPLTGVFLDFQDCEIRLEREGGTFAAVLTSPHLPQPMKTFELEGRFALDHRYLFTGIVLSSASAR